MIKVNNKQITYGHFPDGTLNIKAIDVDIDNVIISWHYENDGEFMAVAFLTKYYQANGKKIELFMPYVPNSRMDRVEKHNDIFTMKYFGEMINSLNFNKVFILDPHSNVCQAVIKNCVAISSDNLFDRTIAYFALIGVKPLIFYPDNGAMKRYHNNNMPCAFGYKKRNWSTGEILGLDILGIKEEDIKGKDIIIRDDICSKGGTFYYSAKKLKELGANNIYLFVTHCENSIHCGEFGDKKETLLDTGLVKKVFTTNSIYKDVNNSRVYVAEIGVELNSEGEKNNE